MEVLYPVAMVTLAFSWVYVIARWVMFEEKPKGWPFRIFSILVVAGGFVAMGYGASL